MTIDLTTSCYHSGLQKRSDSLKDHQKWKGTSIASLVLFICSLFVSPLGHFFACLSRVVPLAQSLSYQDLFYSLAVNKAMSDYIVDFTPLDKIIKECNRCQGCFSSDTPFRLYRNEGGNTHNCCPKCTDYCESKKTTRSAAIAASTLSLLTRPKLPILTLANLPLKSTLSSQP